MHFDKDFFDWIECHRNDDPFRLRLKFLSGKEYPWWLPIAIAHISVLKKANNKLRKAHDNLMPEILYPEIAIEQCSSYDTARLHGAIINRILENCPGKILDMTCGLGIDAMNMAREGHCVVALEINDVQAEIAKYNYRNLDNFQVLAMDCRRFLEEIDEDFDLVFCDPARRNDAGKRVFNISECEPNIIDLLPRLERFSKSLLVKLSPMLDIQQVIRELPKISGIYITESQQECKELLVLVDFSLSQQINQEAIPIEVHNREFDQPFCFTIGEERTSMEERMFTNPGISDFLCVPSPGIMKGGCYNLLCSRFDLKMTGRNNHLYISNRIPTGFPGKIYRVIDMLEWKSNKIKNLSDSWHKASVSARDFPLTSTDVKGKLKLKDDDKHHIFATTVQNGQKMLYLTEREFI